MLDCFFPKSTKITEVISGKSEVLLRAEAGTHRIEVWDEGIVRLTYTERSSFSSRRKNGICGEKKDVAFTVEQEGGKIRIRTGKLLLEADEQTGSCRYFDAQGNLLLAEREENSRELEEFQSYLPAGEEAAVIEKVQTADGEKNIIRESAKIKGEKFYHTRLHLRFQEDEALYGLGQQEEGFFNLRGQTVYLHQANRKIAVPFLVSDKNYGILMHTYSPMIFRDDAYGSYLYTEADDELDFFFICGRDMPDVVKGYRFLTGKAAMLPAWAFGFIQSQERYETQEEILEVAGEHRKRGIGLDCIVLDWCSWPDGQWGQKSMDEVRFPDPSEMIRRLHGQQVHFMLSIWPNMSENTPDYQEMKEEKALLFASNIYNAPSGHAREIYWRQVRENLFCHDIDAWWCDSSEPLTVEWVHQKRMEPEAMYREYCSELSKLLPIWEMNAFSFYHAMTLYEGQRSEREDKRVCNLTRSAYIGQQRFGTILWSGDTSASWQTLRNQIAAGLCFAASGFPYWTVDIGAFFVKHGNFWYWDGDYNDTAADPAYLELYTRWYQWGAFLPVFRAHGTDVRRELWTFTGEEGMFYDAMLKVHRLRYRLLPYLYSQAGRVWLLDEMMMQPLVFAFPADEKVKNIKDQYLLGEALMVCPVTTPVYFERNGKILSDTKKTRTVYLPEGCGWYDFWTGRYYAGGSLIEADADIRTIPLFVREGSILPMTDGTVYADVQAKVSFTVYAGQDSRYLFYTDSGDGYGYEKGEYTLTEYVWKEETKTLTRDGVEIAADCVVKAGAE